MRVLVVVLSVLFANGLSAQVSGLPNTAVADRVATADNRTASLEALQATLYEVSSQYHAVQQMHWNGKGPLFYSLHDLLGHLYADLATQTDIIAERRLALGSPADARPEAVAKNARLAAVPTTLVDGGQVIDVLSRRYETLSERISKRIDATSEDPVTQDILIALKDMIDTHLWKITSFGK